LSNSPPPRKMSLRPSSRTLATLTRWFLRAKRVARKRGKGVRQKRKSLQQSLRKMSCTGRRRTEESGIVAPARKITQK